MTTTVPDPATGLKPNELRLDCLIGRVVYSQTDHRVGRLEEVHAKVHGKGCVITEYLLGSAGLSERLGVSFGLLFGRRGGGYLARWDQIDLSDPDHPRLTCPLEQLKRA